MKIFLDGWGYVIKDLTKDDVLSLLRMIKSAGLSERRDFNGLKGQIENIIESGLIDK